MEAGIGKKIYFLSHTTKKSDPTDFKQSKLHENLICKTVTQNLLKIKQKNNIKTKKQLLWQTGAQNICYGTLWTSNFFP